MEAKTSKLTLELDDELELRLRISAKLKGVSMSEYCKSAIDERLRREEIGGMPNGGNNWEALERAIAWRKKRFGGKRLPGDSADIIREAREIRDAQMDEWRGGHE